MLRTIFMGTPEIAVPALRLLAQRSTVACVLTQPDRPAGRGKQLRPSAVKQAAQALGLPLWQPATLKGQAADPRLDCDLAVVMAYGELLRQEVLDRPRHGCINLHGSLLPRWRGASPIQAALRAGDLRTGVTVMRMVRGLDAGPIHLAEELPIGPGTTQPELHAALAEAAARALGRFLDDFPGGEPRPQDEALVTVCRKLTDLDGRLDFSRSASELERWVRAYTPIPGCWCALGGEERMRILALAPVAACGLVPGQERYETGRLLIGCVDGAVEVLGLQPPGGRPMAARDWLNGRQGRIVR